MPENKIKYKITFTIFIIVIFTPFIYSFIDKDVLVSQIERRKLSPKPVLKLSFNDLKSYPEHFEMYYSDHFGLREQLTKLYKSLIYKLGGSSSDIVIRGKQGWMFLGTFRKGNKERMDPLGDYRNVNRYTKKQLNDVSNYLSSLNNWLESQGIKYYLVIAPSKLNIYSEFLPDYIKKVNTQSAMDQLFDHLKKYTSVKFIDLREVLLKSKEDNLLYYKTGTHWNLIAANIVQYEIMKKLEVDFPNMLYPQLYSDSLFVEDIYYDRGLERMMGIKLKNDAFFTKYPHFLGKKEHSWDFVSNNSNKKSLRKKHTLINDSQLLDIVIFRDSFFRALKPYFEQKFHHSTYIWNQSSITLLKEQFQVEKPDIVLEEWGERLLPFIPKNKNDFDAP